MDTKLREGDLDAGARNLPYSIEGLEEYLQRAMLCLGVRRGSFRYQREFGSRLYQAAPGEHRRALALCQEALESCPGLRAISAEAGETAVTVVIDTPAGRGSVTVQLAEKQEGEAHGTHNL